MEFIESATFVRKSGDRVDFQEALGNAEIIGFYFSAHWCPPCQMFTPVLADMYRELKEKDLPFEVVFVTADRSEEEMMSYMNDTHGDWFALEYDSPIIGDLNNKYDISGIPTLVIVKKDGTLISGDARDDVEMKGPAAYQQWCD